VTQYTDDEGGQVRFVRCLNCRRMLSDNESMLRGVGPDCATRVPSAEVEKWRIAAVEREREARKRRASYEPERRAFWAQVERDREREDQEAAYLERLRRQNEARIAAARGRR
jgi:predicted  nucleic acid-binding Zn-ribbon protein